MFLHFCYNTFFSARTAVFYVPFTCPKLLNITGTSCFSSDNKDIAKNFLFPLPILGARASKLIKSETRQKKEDNFRHPRVILLFYLLLY